MTTLITAAKETKLASDLENNHTGRKLPTLAIRLGFLIENFFT